MSTKTKRLLTLIAAGMVAIFALTACNLPGNNKTATEIELSKTKIRVDVDDSKEISIDNFDDLKNVEIDIDDDDIAEVELTDDTITVTGLSEGDTVITVSAKNCDDEEIKVTVESTAVETTVETSDAQNPVDSGNDQGTMDPANPTDNTDATPDTTPITASDEQVAMYQSYTCTVVFPESVWADSFDDENLVAFFGSLNLTMDFGLELDIDDPHTYEGSGTISMYPDTLIASLETALYDDTNFKEMLRLLMISEGYDPNDKELFDTLYDMKDELIEEIIAGAVESYQNTQTTYGITWRVDEENKFYTTTNGRNKEIGYVNQPDNEIILELAQFGENGEKPAVFGDIDELIFIPNSN